MTNDDNNPVMRRVHAMSALWNDAVEDDATRLIVWRIPRNARRMAAAFFQMQQHAGPWRTPDLFVHLNAAFDTGFEYSRRLKQAMVDSHAASIDTFAAQCIETDWAGPAMSCPDSAAGVLQLLHSFVEHYGQHFRHLALVLDPERVSSPEAITRWIERVMALLPARVRLVLVDTVEDRQWQSLLDRHAAVSRMLMPAIDLFDVARESAALASAGGPAAGFRLQLANLFLLVERGSAEHVAQAATRSLAIAERNGWPDQQAVVHSLLGGAWLKQQHCDAAIAAYQQARQCALKGRAQGHPASADLVTQTWFSEAGAWLVDKQPLRAAGAYRHAALSAAEIPNPMFVIEGYRMAGYCLAQAGDDAQAQSEYLLALEAGRGLPAQQRSTTTLAWVLGDLMRLHDPWVVDALADTARQYQRQIDRAQVQADERAWALGDAPDPRTLETIEADLRQQFAQCFEAARTQRERLIANARAPARRVVAMARELLHPAWNGLPDIAHPLDAEVTAWESPPAWQAQCDAQAPLPTPVRDADRAPRAQAEALACD